MSKDLTTFDSADYLDDAESVAAYLTEYFADGASPNDMIAALGRIARAKGMGDVADKAGLGRESLYKALTATGNPSWITVNKVLAALGLTLKIGAVEKMAFQAKHVAVGQATGTYGGSASRPTGQSRREMAVAASALTQTKSHHETTGKKVAASASKVLRDPKAGKAHKSVAASALTQKKAKK